MPFSITGSVAILAGVLHILSSSSHASPREVARGSRLHELKPPNLSNGRGKKSATLKRKYVFESTEGMAAFVSGPLVSSAETSRQLHDGRTFDGDGRGKRYSVPYRIRYRVRQVAGGATSSLRQISNVLQSTSAIARSRPLHFASVEGTSASSATAAAAAAAAEAAAEEAAASLAPGSSAAITGGPPGAEGRPVTPRVFSVSGSSGGASHGSGVSVTTGGSAASTRGGQTARLTDAGLAVNGPTSTTAAATADDIDITAEIDDGEIVHRQLQGVIPREVDVAGRRVWLRVATPDDFYAVADVRFDVFSPVHSTLKHRFRERSCLLMKERRERGAFCLVAVFEEDPVTAAKEEAAGVREGLVECEGQGQGQRTGAFVPEGHVLGTLECSRHEFDGTPLAVEMDKRETKIDRLYLTEVAVRSDCRRLGVGRVLLGMVDDVARELQTSEVFLHVNEMNEAALRLYSRCGYEEAPDGASNRIFTNSLGLAGGFIGQRHQLLYKTFDLSNGVPSASPSAAAA